MKVRDHKIARLVRELVELNANQMATEVIREGHGPQLMQLVIEGYDFGLATKIVYIAMSLDVTIDSSDYEDDEGSVGL